jgi:hypothetical protein
MRNATRILSAALVAASVGLGACSDSSGPSTTPLSASNAAAVGDAMASTADLVVGALNPAVPDFSGGALLFAGGRSLGQGINFAAPDSLTTCPAASDLTDTDGDGVPDNATWTFTATDCTQTDVEGNRSVVTGAVTISDPGLTAGYDLHLTHMLMQFYQSGAATPLVSLGMNGDWALRGTSDALSLDQDYRVAVTVQNQTVTLTNNLAVNFDVENGSAISWGVPLPNGTLGIDGDWQVVSSSESHSLHLSTPQPLSYDATCGGIVAGILDAYGTGGAVRVTWTGCGTYTAEFMATPQ